MREKKKKRFTWKKYHRWFGLVLSVFMLVFCVSGIILNHRQLFAGCEVSRSLMPSAYHIKNFNNGIIKGSIKINHRISKTPSDSILAYGYGGVWLTDAEMKSWKDFNKGLPKNVDGRNIRNMVQTKNGEIWCAAMMDVYRFDGKEWKMFPLADNEERITDITLTKDSTSIIAMTRSAVYEISGKKTDAANEKTDAANEKTNVTRKIIGQPEGFVPEVTLFKTVWNLHSGAFFGLAGRLVVDAIAIVLIILSITGIILFILPYRIRRQKRLQAREKMQKLGKQMVFNAKWHNKLGYTTIILTLWLAITGMCLRPPLMIPLAMNKTTEKVKDGNVWHDKLRAIRWDAAEGNWLVSTSEGFLRVDEHFQHKPILLNKEKAPKVKKEKPPKEIDRTPPLPKKPVILIFIMALSILILILLGSSNLQYGQDMQQAKDDFASGSYVTAFQTIAGSSVKGKDENFYKKAQVLASIQREYQSYESLSGINENEMALDALIRGYGRCVDGADLAQEYEITDEMAGLKNQILQQLSDHFGVSEEKAAELHAMTKRTDYTKAIQGILAAAGLE